MIKGFQFKVIVHTYKVTLSPVDPRVTYNGCMRGSNPLEHTATPDQDGTDIGYIQGKLESTRIPSGILSFVYHYVNTHVHVV